jgi:PAS domain S-box-containing protein
METLPYVILAVGASFLAILTAIRFALLHREARNKVTVLLLCWSVIWLLMSALEVSTDSLPTKLLFFTLKYVGILAIPTTWAILSLQLAGYEGWVKRSNIAKASVVPLITLFLVLTNGTRGVVWSIVTLNAVDPFLPLDATPNLAYWLLDIAYAYAAVSIAAILLVRRIAVSRTLFRRQAVPLVFVCSVPLMFDVIYNLYNSSLFMYLNLTPLMLTVATSITLWRLDNLPGAGVVPVAHEMIVDSMNDAVIILDSQNRIVDLNLTAQDLLGHRISEAVGAPVEGIWAEWASVEKELESDPTKIKEVSFDGGKKKRTYELQSSYLSGIMSKTPNVLIVLRDITERKRAEEALANERNVLRTLIDNLPDNIFIKDAESRFLISNVAHACLLRAKTPDEIVGKTDYDIFPRELAASYYADEQALIQSGQPLLNREERTIDPDGKTRWLLTTKVPLRDDHGKVIGLAGINRDITERKRMEEKLRQYSSNLEQIVAERTGKLAESEKRFRELADLLPQPVFEVGTEGTFTFVNRAGFALTGYTEEDMRRGVNALDLVVPEEQERLAERMMKVLGGENMRGNEFTAVRKDGSTFPVFLQGVRVMRNENEFVGFRAIAMDITERKRMEEALRESEGKLRTIFDSVKAGIMIIDAKTHVIVDANPAAIEMAGAPREQIVGSVCHKYVCPADRGRCPITDLGQTVDNAERVFIRADGKTCPIMKSVDRIVLGGREHLLESFIDITERKKLEAQLAKSERLAAIGSTTAMVGHDLRNPLQTLVGLVYLVRQHYESIPLEYKKTAEFDATKMLLGIEASVRYMNKIVSDLQNYAAPLQPELARVSTDQLLKESLSTTAIPARVKVSVNVGKGAETLNADPDLIKRVFTNLIMNAVQAMPQGGELKITAQKNGEEELISFQDTGGGISKEAFPKLFEPLFTTKAQGQGLGLAVCKRVMEAHGGTITVDSTIRKGSTFTAKLPIPKNIERKPLPTQ